MDNLKILQALGQTINAHIDKLILVEKKDSQKDEAPVSSSNNPAQQDTNIMRIKQVLLEATTAIQRLTITPADFQEQIVIHNNQVNSLRWLCHFGIPAQVPLNDAISYQDLASKANVPKDQLKRIARMAMTNGILGEDATGGVIHTTLSAKLRPGEPFFDACMMAMEFSGPIAAETIQMTEGWDESNPANKLAFHIRHDTDLTMYAYLAQNPDLAARLAGAMRNLASNGLTDVRHLVNGFDWAGLGRAEVIDVGGSLGMASIELALRFPDLSFVVQDLPDVIRRAQMAFTKHKKHDVLSRRITFESHDFFKIQPVSNNDASIFLLRQILNNWSDDLACDILSQITRGMKSSARLVIMNSVLPEPGNYMNIREEARNRATDLFMMQATGGKERDMGEWTALMKRVDANLVIKGVQKPVGSSYCVLEVGFIGEQEK